MGKIAGAVGMIWVESFKKNFGLIFIQTSEDHNFCSSYQNHYYFICISGGIWFPSLVKLASPVCKLKFFRKCHFLHFSNIFCYFSYFFQDFFSRSYGACFGLKFLPLLLRHWTWCEKKLEQLELSELRVLKKFWTDF